MWKWEKGPAYICSIFRAATRGHAAEKGIEQPAPRIARIELDFRVTLGLVSLRRKVVRVLVFLIALSCFGANFSATTPPRVLAFEARNQQYVSHGPGYSLSVTARAAVLDLRGHLFRISLAGANRKQSLEALDRMPGKASYLLGSDLRASYDLYGQVRWRAVYPGIDLLFRGNQEHLEYDLEIGAGRDPRRIEIDFEGADEIRIDPSGALILRAGQFEIRQPAPIAFQVLAGRKTLVSIAYQLNSSHHVGFRIGRYDRTQPLVIDPQLVFDNSFGGAGATSAAGIAMDTLGNIYVAGQTNSAAFPAQSAAQSHPGAAPLLASADGGQTWTGVALGAAVTVQSMASAPTEPSVLYAATNVGVLKSSDGGTTWTTPANTGLTAPMAVAVDAGSASTVYAASYQNIFVSNNGGANWTVSTNGLPVTNANPPPPLFSGLLANPRRPGTVFAIPLSLGSLYRSTDFGQTWTQLSIPASGSLVFSPTDPDTLFLGRSAGGILTSTDDGNTWTSLSSQSVGSPQALAIFPGNPSILLASYGSVLSRSSDGGKTWKVVLFPLGLPVVAADPGSAGVAYTLDGSGLYRSTDYGQTWTKSALPYANLNLTLFVSADSRVFVGEGTSTDAFITKWSPDGNKILYSTYLGGSANDCATGLAADGTGSVYVTGITNSPDFPVSKNAFQKSLAGPVGSNNAFITKLSPDGSQLVYSTFLGGGGELGSRIALNPAGEAVIAGATDSAKFPTTPGASQSAPVTGCSIGSPFVENGGTAFVSKLSADGGSLVYSTLLRGSCATRALAVSLDASGNAWVAGYTDSPDFPVTKDARQPALAGDVYDGFLARFSPNGALAYSTYLGGKGYDTVNGLTLDQKGNIYLTGTTGGLSQPASSGAFESQVSIACVVFSIGPSVYQTVGSAFVLKLDPTAHTTLGLTYLGSPLCLYPLSIAVDAAGEPWIGGI
jgi:photosystem II stability/assembly factor-like uncharacterized protein